MRVPLSWLRDYVEITISAEELAEQLTLGGLEVEQVEYIGVARPDGQRAGHATGAPESGERPELAWDPARIFVGQILEVKPHPNADRLTLAIVDYAHGTPIQVVTGAPNIRVGDSGLKVAFALEGARLYDGHAAGWKPMTLKKGKIRGIESGCMVLSEKELGMSEDHEGIILLPSDAPVGKPLVQYLGDVIYEVKINPNMARAASILGVAREVAALTGKPVRPPSLDVVARGASIQGQVQIVIQEPSLNPRFTAALIRNVEIKPSPFLVQQRLKLAGMRPINNIVDVTNYVMLEIGQPLHAFDYDKLYARAGGRPPTIITRLAGPGEELETLDGVKRRLDPFSILVCDTRGALSIGGVMGGAASEVDERSKNILLEAAAWEYINIRKTMKAQHLASEAGYRFSRGVAPSQAIVGLKRAIEMMRELGGGEIAGGEIDEYPGKSREIVVTLPVAEVKRQLGVEIPPAQIKTFLERLDFQVETANRQGDPVQLRVTVPDYRLDVDGTDDLIEEIARLYGYQNIPISRMNDELPPQWTNVELEQEEQVRDLLIDSGLQEVMSNILTTSEREGMLMLSADAPLPLPAREYVRIENPISAERTAMRQTLLANLLDLTAANLRYRTRVAFFELGNVFWAKSDRDVLLPRERSAMLAEDEELPLERRRLGILLTGPRAELSWTKADTTPVDFYDLKGVLQELLEGLHISGAGFVASDNPLFHPGRAAALVLDSQEIGAFGELHPLLRERFDLPAQAILLGEFDLDALLAHVSPMFSVRSPSRYPAVIQDLAVVVEESVLDERVYTLIRQTGGDLLQRAVLFDVYRGEPIPPGRKSLAYALTFQAMDRTLSDADASKIRDKIVNRLRNEIGAELRGG
ncbi:MAG: phenylalanine--tRNA ligase subunit beta [Acidobacteriota bacterium]